MQTPSNEGATPEEIKQRVRAGHLVRRDAQLREPAVAEFVRGLEQRRLGPAGWVSIFSLMRDGRDLAKRLTEATQESSEAKRAETAEVRCGALRAGSGNGCRLPGHGAEADGYLAVFPPHMGQHLQVLARALHDAAGSRCCRPLPSGHWHCCDRKFCRTALDQGRVDRLGFRRVHQDAGQEQPSAAWCRWIHESIDRLIEGAVPERLGSCRGPSAAAFVKAHGGGHSKAGAGRSKRDQGAPSGRIRSGAQTRR